MVSVVISLFWSMVKTIWEHHAMSDASSRFVTKSRTWELSMVRWNISRCMRVPLYVNSFVQCQPTRHGLRIVSLSAQDWCFAIQQEKKSPTCAEQTEPVKQLLKLYSELLPQAFLCQSGNHSHRMIAFSIQLWQRGNIFPCDPVHFVEQPCMHVVSKWRSEYSKGKTSHPAVLKCRSSKQTNRSPCQE